MTTELPADLKRLPVALTVAEYATVMRLSRQGAYDSINRGDVRATRLGSKIIVPRSEVERLLGVDRD